MRLKFCNLFFAIGAWAWVPPAAIADGPDAATTALLEKSLAHHEANRRIQMQVERNESFPNGGFTPGGPVGPFIEHVECLCRREGALSNPESVLLDIRGTTRWQNNNGRRTAFRVVFRKGLFVFYDDVVGERHNNGSVSRAPSDEYHEYFSNWNCADRIGGPLDGWCGDMNDVHICRLLLESQTALCSAIN